MLRFVDISGDKYKGTAWECEVTSQDRQIIRITVHRHVHYDPQAWLLSSLTLQIQNSELCCGQEFSAEMAQHLAIKRCAVIAHDRADALTRACLGQG